MSNNEDFSHIENTLRFLSRGYATIDANKQHTQLGVHFEEIAEMLSALEGTDQKSQFLLDMVRQANEALSLYLKQNDNVIRVKNPVAFLDGLCDQIVTAVGVGYVFDFDMIGALGEVNKSNLSKFDENGNPLHDENGKIIKGPNYFKPNLTSFVLKTK